MSNKIIAASLSIDTGNSNANIKEVNKNLADTNTAIKSTSESVKQSSSVFTNLKSQIASVPGPLKDASEGVEGLSTSFKALLANPVVLTITAIVGALAFLYKAFTNTKSGADQMEQQFAGIKAAAGAVLDAIFELGGAIIKFFSGDFKGAFAQAKGAITGVVSAVQDAYGSMKTLTAQAQELHKRQLQNDLEQAERAKQLAILREQANDESVPRAERIKALNQLHDLSVKNAKEDIALAKETADNEIARYSVGKDAALKNQDQINQSKIKAVQVETDNANELRRIDKQITAANKQEIAERQAAAKAAAEQAKKDRDQLDAFNTQLNKLKGENALAGITDQYTKEKQLLENKIRDEQNLIHKQFADGKITRDQFNQLEIAQEDSARIQRQALTDKHNTDVAASEAKFQKQLADIRSKTAVDGIIDQAKKEQVQLEISHQQELAQAAKDYAGDADKLFQIKAAIDAEFAAKQTALAAKNKAAADKKAFDDLTKKNKGIISDPNATIKAKQAALDADVKANQDAFDAKKITEDEYLDNKRKNDDAEKQIDDLKLQRVFKYADAAKETFDNLAELVGKNTAAGKAFAVASATINTIESAVSAFKAMAPIPYVGPVLGAIAAAAAAAAGYANIKKILAVQIPGQGGGGGSAPSGISIPTAPVAPKQSSTQLDQKSINQIGLQNTQRPIRAYVVHDDSEAAATRAARLASNAQLGGTHN